MAISRASAFTHACRFGLMGLLVAAVPAVPAVTFTPHYVDASGEGFFDPLYGAQRRQGFEFALSIWQSRVPGASAVHVDVDASFDPLGGTRNSATLGQGGPTSFYAGFAGSPHADQAYPAALANYLAGSDLSGTASDVDIAFNSDVDGLVLGSASWYYGLDGQVPAGDVDFVTVALHELTHSLGFISTGFSDGTFGADTSRGTMPDSFDAYLVNGGGAKLTSLAPKSANVTKPVYWSGPLGLQQYRQAFGGNGMPRIYSPTVFQDGSSLSHLDEGKFTGQYDLMTPVASEPIHVPDDIVRGMMADVGWQVVGTGDTNANGVVDLQDVFSLIKHIGSRYGDANYSMLLDVNLDGIIDSGDMAALSGHFGQYGLLGTAPAGHQGLVAASLAGTPWPAGQMTILPGVRESLIYQAVPEPLTLGLVLAGLLAVAARRRPRTEC